MAYQVLARKWRPKTFADLVGQEHVVKALRNALDKGRLHHAYLLTGTRGVGKTTIARILAKSLNCDAAQQGEPCGQCESCVQIDSGRFVDLLEIDAASNTGIDNIREVLENAQYAPTAGKYKVYIIDEVHMLSKSAFNAMLKTLEEPPEHVKFILATTDPHKVPITVLSRCLQFVLRNMTAQQVAEHLAKVLTIEEIAFEMPALQLLGRAAAGSMRDALSLLDQAIAMGSGRVTEHDVRHMIGAVDKQYLYQLLQGIVNHDGAALLNTAQEMAARAVGFDYALGELALLLQRLALLQTVPSAISRDDPEYAVLQQISSYLSGEQIQLYYQCAIHGKQDLALAPDEYAGFVMTLLRMLAFAPFAAKHQPIDGRIEGTAFHDAETTSAHTDSVAPLVLPKQATEISTTEPETAAVNEKPDWQAAWASVADVPPWEDLPEEMAQVAVAVQEKQETVAVEPVLSNDVVSASPEQEEWNDTPDTLSHDVDDTPPPYHAEALDTFVFQPDEEAEEAEVEPTPDLPLPEFKAEHWAQMVKQLATKLGVAQMLANYSAWVSFDEQAGVLLLSLNGNAATVTRKEYFDKIRQVLAEAYALPQLKLQTCPWQPEMGWETPAMQQQRWQQEGKAQARQLLADDPVCQKLMHELGCDEWIDDSLQLINP